MKKLVILLMFCVFLFSWELKKDENGIKVYTQEVKNSKYDEFKSETVVKENFKKIKSVLLNFKNYPKWQKKIKTIEVKNGYMLKVLSFPFPFSNRFAFYKIDIKKTASQIEIDLTSIPYKLLPEKIKKIFKKPSGVEMKDDVVFKALKTGNGVKVVYSAKVDPKGPPAFIFNSKIVTAGYKTLKNLKEELKE